MPLKFSSIDPLLQRWLVSAVLAVSCFYLFAYDELAAYPTLAIPMVTQAVTYIGVCTVSLVLISYVPWLFMITWTLVCIAAFLCSYAKETYGTLINYELIAILLQATPTEIHAVFNLDVLTAFFKGLTLGLLGGLAMGSAARKKSPLSEKFLVVVLCLCMGGYLLSELPPAAQKTMPFKFFFVIRNYIHQSDELKTAMRNRKNIGINAGIFHHNPDDPLYVVLVIGESATADHFSLGGYGRETNPLLKTVPNLMYFQHTKPCAIWTMYAVPCLVSRATHDNWRPMYQETSIVSVFKGLGFKTVWLDGQGIYRSIDPQTFVQKEADINRNYTGYHGRYDDIMLPDYADALDERQPSLIVMHMEGSHFYYHDRYSDSFKYFTPACAARGYDSLGQIFRNIWECGKGPELVNAYDNSIRYTDWFLNEAIGKLKNKNALFIYVSDHGEALGENGLYSHGNISTPAVWHVPMIWWGSDRFIQNYPRQWEALQLKTAKNTSHDNIFHSMLDCIGVESRLINKFLSLCKEEKPSTP